MMKIHGFFVVIVGILLLMGSVQATKVVLLNFDGDPSFPSLTFQMKTVGLNSFSGSAFGLTESQKNEVTTKIVTLVTADYAPYDVYFITNKNLLHDYTWGIDDTAYVYTTNNVAPWPDVDPYESCLSGYTCARLFGKAANNPGDEDKWGDNIYHPFYARTFAGSFALGSGTASPSSPSLYSHTTDQIAQALANSAAHELGHICGLVHNGGAGSGNLMYVESEGVESTQNKYFSSGDNTKLMNFFGPKPAQGIVTITIEGSGSEFIGKNVTLSGTNTQSQKMYLFATGPGLAPNGAPLDQINEAAENGAFTEIDVAQDHTWTYTWNTSPISGYTLYPGTYTIYACADPVDKSQITGHTYDTASILLKSIPGTLVLTSPNGGEVWEKGTSHLITWSYTGNPGSSLDIWLSKGGDTGSSIQYGVSLGSAGSGSYLWTIDNDPIAGSDYKVDIHINETGIDDESNQFFSLTDPPASLTVIAPNGGDGYAVNHGYGLQWEYTGSSDQQVKIELFKGGSLSTVLAPSEPIGSDGLGYYYWMVSPTQTIGDDYSIKISNTVDSTINDTSDAPFSVNPYSGVFLLTPDGGETWQQGSTYPITWNHYSSWHATHAELYLLKNNQVVSTINTTVPLGNNHQGSYDWEIPLSVVPGNDYKIRIYTIPGGDSDDSNAAFMVTSVLVTLPDASFTINTNSGTAPLPVLFTDTSTGSGITAWNWSFGDGLWENNTVSTNPIHTYAAGTWHPTLTVTNASGSNTSVVTSARTITVITPPSTTSSTIGVTNGQTWYLDNDGSGTWNAGDSANSFGAPGWTSVLGDWNGNGKTEIGVYQNGAWYLDHDGSGGWNGGDKAYSFGAPGWAPVVGNWNGDATGTKIGVYQNGAWYLDNDGSGTWNTGDKAYSFGATGWTPVLGDWNPAVPGMKIGIYKNGMWYLDNDGSGTWNTGDKAYSFGAAGWTPVIGDWNPAIPGDKIGVYKDVTWYLDWNGNGAWDQGTDKAYSFGAPGWTPVIGNWNPTVPGTKIGIYKDGMWYLDNDGSGGWNTGDKAYSFGALSWTPVVGKWT